MKYVFYIISTTLLVLASAGTTFAEAMSYESYSSGAVDFCETTAKEKWNTGSRLTPKLLYPELRSEAVNAWMSSQITNEQGTLAKAYLTTALDPARIGSFDGWRALEVAQSVYNARMNTLFDCAVIESRISIITGLKEAKAIKGKSEITDKLEKEMKALERKSKQCLPDESGTATSATPTTLTRKVTDRLVNSIVLQNCHYTKYLTYLESRIDDDMSNTLTIDTQIGDNSTKQIPADTDTMRRTVGQRQEQIRLEIALAYRTLPRAILAYQEMTRTYAAHLLLVIVYDDYVRLRDNLAKYANATSQLFEKAYNAMTP